MSMVSDHDSRFRRLGLKLGLFVGVGLLLGIGLLVALAVRQGYFAAKTPVRFEAGSGSDLRPGMAVKLSGFKIGEVSQVALNRQARVDVEMQVEDRYMQWIKSDSIATLAREGMIGDSFISLTSGNPMLPALAPEDRLRFELGRSVGDIALDLRNRVVPVIDEMNALLKYANDPDGNVRGSFAELRRLATELQASRRQLDAALQQVNKAAAQEVPATLEQARSTLTRAEASLAELERAIPVLSAQAARSLESLEAAATGAAQTTGRAEKFLDDVAPRLERTLAETEALARDSRAAVNAARTRWPFSGSAQASPALMDAGK